MASRGKEDIVVYLFRRNEIEADVSSILRVRRLLWSAIVAKGDRGKSRRRCGETTAEPLPMALEAAHNDMIDTSLPAFIRRGVRSPYSAPKQTSPILSRLESDIFLISETKSGENAGLLKRHNCDRKQSGRPRTRKRTS